MERSIPEIRRRSRPAGARFRRRRRSAVESRMARWVFMLCALVSILATVGIVVSLVSQSMGFFREVPVWEFLFGTNWSPILKPTSFGVLPLVAGTVLVAILAAGVAVPVGLATAIFLAEYAPPGVRKTVKPTLEVLAGIPTVVYGYFALTFVTPLLQVVFPDMIVFNALSAGLVMGIMIVPMVSSLSEDAMVAVPRSLREAAFALGATRLEVSLKVVVPAALSGIVAAFILAISRAIGETMLVTIAAGATPNLTVNPLQPIQTMTAYIVQLSLGEAVHGSLEFNTIFAVALLLFAITLLMNLCGAVGCASMAGGVLMPSVDARFNRRLAFRRGVGRAFYIAFLSAVLIGIAALLTLLGQVLVEGVPWLSWHFLTDFPSRHPEEAGLKSAIMGTLWILGLTGGLTIPIGVGAAIYLEEYAPKNWLTRVIEVNISNLAGVPSIVYGLLGLALFVQLLALGRSLLAGAMTLSLLVLPIVILASREAIRAVPDTYRQAAHALGANEWQVIKGVVLPAALPAA